MSNSSSGIAEVPEQSGWIPFDLVAESGGMRVEWRFIGDAPLLEPWFEFSVRRYGCDENGRPRRMRTPIGALDRPPGDPVPPPAGIIFHASRCGSTLLCQMLARSPRFTVLAEPPIVEALIDWSSRRGGAAARRLASRLTNALAYLARSRGAEETRWLLKTESQQILDRPLFESLYPEVPWIFLYRDPAEILHSHLHQRGRQMVPYMINPGRLGRRWEQIDPARLDDYGALMLEHTFAAAVAALEGGAGRAVDYRRLPAYAWEEVDGLFGLGLSEPEIREMMERSRFDAKTPSTPYAGGTSRKEPIPESLRALTSGRLEELHGRLEALEGRG